MCDGGDGRGRGCGNLEADVRLVAPRRLVKGVAAGATQQLVRALEARGGDRIRRPGGRVALGTVTDVARQQQQQCGRWSTAHGVGAYRHQRDARVRYNHADTRLRVETLRTRHAEDERTFETRDGGDTRVALEARKRLGR